MPVTCQEILEFAKSCLENDNEINHRNAVSRAYYAAYHSVYPILKHGPKDSHQGLIDYLQGDALRGNEDYDNKDLKALSFMLSNMKNLRKISDYNLNYSVRKIDADIAVKTADKLLTKILEISKPKIA